MSRENKKKDIKIEILIMETISEEDEIEGKFKDSTWLETDVLSLFPLLH